MKKIVLSLVVITVLVGSVVTLRAQGAGTTVETAGGSAAFTSPTALLGVNLSGSTFGSGVSFNGDGTVDGNLEEVLSGTDAITGLAATIVVDAAITGGSSNADGSVTVTGTATVTTASQTLSGVPITAVITTAGITLTVGTTTLSPQALTDGAIFIGQ